MMKMPEHLLIGLSGGADSVALLHLLRESGCCLTAVHVNHGLRGDASDGDEQFVRALCQRLNVPLLVYRAAPCGETSESWAREVRYGFFRQAAEETGVHAIALAHHRDDQAETLLLHLLRGTGLSGLCGMAEDSTIDGLRILRPLLGYTRQALRDMLTARGEPWREDASNLDTRYLRNALRQDILPGLMHLQPEAAAHLAQTAALLREDEDTLRELTARFLAQHSGRCLPLEALRQQPRGLFKRILRAWFEPCGGVLTAVQTGALADLLDSPVPSRCNLPGGWHGQRGWTHLHLVPPDAPAPMQPLAVQDAPGLTVLPFTGEMGDGRRKQVIPKELLADCVIRTRQRGDFIRPFGSGGRQSLQDYFTNRRVDAPFRDQVPLLCRGAEVLVAFGVGAGDVPHVDAAKDKNDYVTLCHTGLMPWHRE